MNEEDFALYKEIVLTLLGNINVAESKSGYGYHIIVERIREYADETFVILMEKRNQLRDEEET